MIRVAGIRTEAKRLALDRLGIANDLTFSGIFTTIRHRIRNGENDLWLLKDRLDRMLDGARPFD